MTETRVPIAVLASGRGSNFAALCERVAEGRLAARVTALISDRADAGALAIARQHGIPAHVIAPEAKPEPRREAKGGAPDGIKPSGEIGERKRRHERAILDALSNDPPRFLVLAGYLRVLGPELLSAFRSERGYSRVVNIHPSLLPSFPGLDAYDQAFRHGVKVTGASVHLVDGTIDTGPICAQEAFSIESCRSADEVRGLGLELEHRLYGQALTWILPERFELEGERHVRPH